MNTSSTLPVKGKAFVAAVSTLGLLSLLHSCISIFTINLSPHWLILAALTIFSSAFTVRIPALPASVSVSETFVFLLLLMFGPAAATVTVALDGLLISFLHRQSRRKPYRIFFNTAEPALSVWVAGQVFVFISTLVAQGVSQPSVQTLVLPLGLSALVYFLLNSLLTARAVGYETGERPISIWQNHFSWVFVNYLGGASLALLLFSTAPQISLGAIGVVIPLLVITYLAFKSAMARVEDTTHHLKELNELYLSTIETLAMAVDAKDQITHGHIRRVQRHAVLLAKAVGITDEKLIKAIEAAALLHDMGKLGVPEYILNKPGQLTPAEFEKMKAHSCIGADILSGVKFPYPVVPMVRHHHEHWDGSGYPDGLKGADIPIGARILAVVDCFDALTSDRPYRPRLSEEAALGVLSERRDTIYDPLVVDTFLTLWRAEKQQIRSAVQPDRGAEGLTLPESSTRSFDTISSSSGEVVALHNLVRDIVHQPTTERAAELLCREVRRFVPAALVAFYAYDTSKDELVAIRTIGVAASTFGGLHVQVGKGITGWVAANRTPILNSDPSLDFGEGTRSIEPRLRSTLSVPVAGNRLVGVISCYSSNPNAFTNDHVRVVEAFVRQVCALLDTPRGAIVGSEYKVDPATGFRLFQGRSD